MMNCLDKKNLGQRIIIERMTGCDSLVAAIHSGAEVSMGKNYLSSLAFVTLERGILLRPIRRRKHDRRAWNNAQEIILDQK